MNINVISALLCDVKPYMFGTLSPGDLEENNRSVLYCSLEALKA